MTGQHQLRHLRVDGKAWKELSVAWTGAQYEVTVRAYSVAEPRPDVFRTVGSPQVLNVVQKPATRFRGQVLRTLSQHHLLAFVNGEYDYELTDNQAE